MTSQNNDTFNTSLSDAQANVVTPLLPGKSDIEACTDYEQKLPEKCLQLRKNRNKLTE